MKTTNILLALGLFVTASLSAADDVFVLRTKVITLPQKEFAPKQKLDGLISDGELQQFIRDTAKLKHGELFIMPSIAVKLNKVEQIKIVSEKTVTRIDAENQENTGHVVTYRLESIDGVLRLDGIFKHSEVNDGEKPGIVAINTEEIVFKRNCALDKTIMISKGDTHIFITVTQLIEE
jgi:hypothetical protein